MNIVVVPGIHSSQFTYAFVQALNPLLDRAWVVPSQSVPVYSPQHVFTFLRQKYGLPMAQQSKTCHESQIFLFIGFSAGVVGCMGAARRWQSQVGHVKAIIAFDGWGVPLYGPFPIHRVSHDYWTHWSSGFAGKTQTSFYANPPVDHLDLWRSPHTASGVCTDSQWSYDRSNVQQPETAATFVRSLLEHYMD